MNWVGENFQGVLAAVGTVYLAALAIAKLTPTDKDDKALKAIGGLLSLLGFKHRGNG